MATKMDKSPVPSKVKLRNGLKLVRANFDFDINEWPTQDTYNGNCTLLPGSPGVYLIVATDMLDKHKTMQQEIVYIGSSRNIKKRVKTHPVVRVVKAYHFSVSVHFKECGNYLQIEKELIGKYNPRINING